MIYSSMLFVYGFFPLSLLIYYAVPKKYSEKVLLGLSAVFCGVMSLYFLIFMVFYILFNYSMCRIIEFLKKKKSIPEVPLASMIILDITVIFAFRTPYMEWFSDMIHAPDGFFPIGISFFTLSVIGTLIDVYKGKQKTEPDIVRFALYIVFFPKLIMGPVMRYSTFCKKIDKQQRGLSEIGTGVSIFVKGLAKKVIFADTLFMLYSAVNNTEGTRCTSLTALLGIAAYLFCLYFNMSGFADMGNGIAWCFGYRFPKSFCYPLFSKKVRLFMSRWLTQVNMWFRRYAEKPIASVCRKKWLKTAVFVLAWGITGFWYTFTLNGFAGGFFIGIVLLAEGRFAGQNNMKITGITYTFAVSMLWAVSLSCSSISSSFRYISALFGRNGLADSLSLYLFKSYIPVLILSVLFSVDIFGKLTKKIGAKKYFDTVFTLFTPIIVLGMLVLCTIFMSSDGVSEMMQFRF